MTRPTFSGEIRELAQRFAGRPIRIGELMDATSGRGSNLLLLLITLPFLTPIPLPGFSIPFGVAVAAMGTRLALGQQPWLPRKIRARELSPRFSAMLFGTAVRVLQWLEVVLRPRLLFVHEQVIFRRVAGLLTAISGLFLIIPLPLPFSNSLPAATVFLLAAGALEKDGVSFLGGCGMFLLSSAYFVLLAIGGAEAVEHLKAMLRGG